MSDVSQRFVITHPEWASKKSVLRFEARDCRERIQMTSQSFRMKPASLKKGLRYQELSFSAFVECGDGLSDPIITGVCGRDLDYGKVFAYCFRRFGYPNFGWDSYKDLARYLLSTPRSDMLLSVVPYVGQDAAITLRFLATSDVLSKIDGYARRFQLAWEGRSLNWREQQGLPQWMPEWLKFYNGDFRAQCNGRFPVQSDWRKCIDFPFALGPEGSPALTLTQRVVDFRKKLRDDYEKVEAYPAYCLRAADWNQWEDADPLKPYAEAAAIALKDLRRPVGVRDCAIDAFGETELGRRCAKAAAVAGYPSGDLGNQAPKEFAELHNVVLKLGKGNAKRGIEKVLASVEMSSEITPQIDESGPSP